MTRMRMVQENPWTRSSIPARTGMMNSRKSGTISFHVIVIAVNFSGLPFLKNRALSRPLPNAQVLP